MRIAILHHWFVTRGGGERVAEMIAALFPDADIFTLVHDRGEIPATMRQRRLHSSFLQYFPFASKLHRHFLPLYPSAAEHLDLRGYDLVLSSDSGPIKGARMDAEAIHICYCHTPMRYLWDVLDAYQRSMNAPTALIFRTIAPWVREWDRKAARRVTYFLANSKYIAKRIGMAYGREAEVIYPPIAVNRAKAVLDIKPGEAYLCAGRLVHYKRTDLAIRACMKLGRKLRVVGDGPEMAKLKRLAGGDPNIVFRGITSTQDLWKEYAQCRALLFSADEDFGMVPLEAQACGRPVIAYGAGGSLETVRGSGPDATGMYFAEQTVDSLVEAMLQWEGGLESQFRPDAAREWTRRFEMQCFLKRYRAFVLERVPEAAGQSASADEAAKLLA